jgi:hypothetical protein
MMENVRCPPLIRRVGKAMQFDGLNETFQQIRSTKMAAAIKPTNSTMQIQADIPLSSRPN